MTSTVSLDSILSDRICIFLWIFYYLQGSGTPGISMKRVSDMATWLEDEIRKLETPITWPECCIHLSYMLIQSNL